MPSLVLASASPRRADLLSSLGIEFEARPANVDESRRPDEPPEDFVERLSRAKAAAVAKPGELLLAADTIVVLDRRVLGKPNDEAESREMLTALSGRWHRVLTGVALFESDSGREAHDVAESRVLMRRLTNAEISWYAATGEPRDKAGSYALQGLGALFVDRIEGTSSNVIGLPMPLVYELFLRLDLDLTRLCHGTKRLEELDRLPPK